jgi:hypothetical protein
MLEMKENYPRVSTILDRLQDKSHIPEQVLEKAGIRGTNVHQAIFDEINGEFAIYNEEEKLYVDSWRTWNKINCPTYDLNEVRFYDHELKFTGQIDSVVRFPYTPSLFLLDFKTSSQVNYDIWNLQAHAYYHLLTKSTHKVSPQFMFLKLSKCGQMAKEYIFTYDQKVMDRFYEELKKYWEEKLNVENNSEEL